MFSPQSTPVQPSFFISASTNCRAFFPSCLTSILAVLQVLYVSNVIRVLGQYHLREIDLACSGGRGQDAGCGSDIDDVALGSGDPCSEVDLPDWLFYFYCDDVTSCAGSHREPVETLCVDGVTGFPGLAGGDDGVDGLAVAATVGRSFVCKRHNCSL